MSSVAIQSTSMEPAMMQPITKKIDSNDFYSEYMGHKIEHLEALLPMLRSSSDSLIFLAGDSSGGSM